MKAGGRGSPERIVFYCPFPDQLFEDITDLLYCFLMTSKRRVSRMHCPIRRTFSDKGNAIWRSRQRGIPRAGRKEFGVIADIAKINIKTYISRFRGNVNFFGEIKEGEVKKKRMKLEPK